MIWRRSPAMLVESRQRGKESSNSALKIGSSKYSSKRLGEATKFISICLFESNPLQNLEANPRSSAIAKKQSTSNECFSRTMVLISFSASTTSLRRNLRMRLSRLETYRLSNVLRCKLEGVVFITCSLSRRYDCSMGGHNTVR